MKNRKNFFFLLPLLIVFLLYPSNAMAAMASMAPDTESITDSETEIPKPLELPAEASADSETELPELPAETPADSEEEPPEPSELPAETSADPEAEPSEPIEEVIEEPDSVSTGAELMEWMESHKDTGGLVKLTDHIVLDTHYAFVLAASAPAQHIFVETAGYTITVTSAVEFWSNAHLTFRGPADEYGIFRVITGGVLSLNGISVEGGPYSEEQLSDNIRQYALWQEEGAGLVVSDCQVSGDIHYADTPFILYRNSTYALVEKEQTAESVLPSEMKCDVNYQGQVSHSTPVQVAWNLEGTEKWQAQRLRFQVQGSFSHAASEVPPVCAVVYNDYPLTFTEVEARVSSKFYTFRGGYTKPEEFQQMKLISEYSFDEKNWVVYDESTQTDTEGTFFIGLQFEMWDTEKYPYLYIRLQGEHDGIRYFSNVLCYTADNLETAEDQGGNRGGGTSIVNPPDTPQEEPGHVASGGESAPDTVTEEITGTGTTAKPEDSANPETTAKPEDSAGAGTAAKPEDSAGAGTAAKPEGSAGAGTTAKPADGAGTDTVAKSEGSAGIKPESSADNGAGTETKPKSSMDGSAAENAAEGRRSSEQAPAYSAVDDGTGAAGSESSTDINIAESKNTSDTNRSGTVADIKPVSQSMTSRIQETTVQNVRRSRIIVIVSGFVMLSAIAGAAGFCIHTGVFRKLVHAVKGLLK